MSALTILELLGELGINVKLNQRVFYKGSHQNILTIYFLIKYENPMQLFMAVVDFEIIIKI